MIRGMNLTLEQALARQKRDNLIIRQARKMSLAEIGRLHGLTRERVRQIVLAATKKPS
jgi:DNA-directed RNA polymerase sigma subunit (sigma70/sigma32)